MAEHLTTIEASELAEAEKHIESCLNRFIDVGRELTRINLRRLYRQTYASFEAYCAERWGISKARAYQLMGAAEQADYLSTIGRQLLPENERQYRTLGQLCNKEDQLAVWRLALANSEGEQPAADALAKLVADRVAALTDEQQLAVTEEHQEHVAKQMRGTHTNPWILAAQIRSALRKVKFGYATFEEEKKKKVDQRTLDYIRDMMEIIG